MIIDERKHNLLVALAATVAVYVITFLVFGWTTDSYQSMLEYTMTGEITNHFPVTGDPFPEYMPGAARLFNYLQSTYAVRWVTIVLSTLQFIAIYTIFYNLLSCYKKEDKWQKLAGIILISAFTIESVTLYHMVRVGMLIGIASLVWLLRSEPERLKKFFPREMLPYILLMIIASWVRFSTIVFVLISITGLFLLLRKSLKPLVVLYVVLAFFSFRDLTLTQDRYSQNYYYYLYNVEFKLFFAAQTNAPVRLADEADSLKYLGLQQQFFNDEANINKAFLDRIGIFETFSRFRKESALYAAYNFYLNMIDGKPYILLDLLFLVACLAVINPGVPGYRRKIILACAGFYLIIIGICFLKMESRFLSPFRLFFMLSIMLSLRPGIFFNVRYRYVAVLLSIIYLASNCYNTSKLVKQEKEYYQHYVDAFDGISKKYNDHTLVLNTYLMINGKPLELFKQPAAFRHFYFYNQIGVLGPVYRPYLENECKCDVGAFAPFYDFLIEQRQPVLLIDYSQRIELLEKYLAVVHNRHYKFERVQLDTATQGELNSIIAGENLAAYTMKKAETDAGVVNETTIVQ